MKYNSHTIISILLSLLALRAYAQNTLPSSGSASTQAWETERWTGNDTPFIKERKKLEMATVKQLRAVLPEGRRLSPNSNPQPAVWFRYGTAAYLLTTKWKQNAEGDLARASALSARVSSPHTPTFTRLRFLLTARGFPQPELKNIGLRLAQRDTRDYDVRYFLCSSLVPDRIPANKQLALRMCDQMQRLSPKRASAYSSQGSVYFRCWLARRDKQDRERALAAYNRYLQLAPNNDLFRPQAQRLIAMMNKK